MSNTARDLQTLQASILANIWTELADNSYDFDSLVIKSLNSTYDATVESLKALLGEDAPVTAIDMGLAETHATLYKDRAGFKPGCTSYKSAKAYVESCKDSDLTDDDVLEMAELASNMI